MLDQIDVGQMIAQKWDELSSPPALPDEWSQFLCKTGPLPSMQGCRRRVSRFHFRQKAMLQRDGEPYAVCTKDVSREEISFVIGCQLFPCERVKLWLPNGLNSELTVARCLRIAPSCYECGARFALAEGEAEHVAAILRMATQNR